ncbi:MAG: TadE/TadG family type IV pilus assembly protein [Croceibacterium sp.]
MIARLRDQRGTMAIETALITPLLAMMALGVFEVSSIVSREQQLQSAANEASEIILAAAGGSGINSDDLEAIIVTSLGLSPSEVVIDPRYRCGTASTLTTTVPSPSTGCAASEQVYSYVQLTVTDTYSPMWTRFGVSAPINYTIVRTVQVS